MITIWHNPRCSKSRETLAMIEGRGEIFVRKYLEDAPTETELREALFLLQIAAIEMMRVKEKRFKELGLSKTDSDDALIAAMSENPVLIERPIVFFSGKAAIGRPPENVLSILPA